LVAADLLIWQTGRSGGRHRIENFSLSRRRGMKRLLIGLAILSALLSPHRLVAQEPTPAPSRDVTERFPVVPDWETGAPTESMWFYLQELRRYDDPRTVTRRVAEEKADQRRARLAAQKWYGYLAGRPLASHTPFMGTYSPMWVGNGKDAFQWVGSGFVNTAVRLDLRNQVR
jgi:hypothetical protein